MHDRTDNGGSLKMLTLIDEYSRQCLKIKVGRKLKSKKVLDALAEAMAKRGVPHHIRSDNASSSPGTSRTGSGRWGSRRSTSILEALGRTAM
ncbi:MAG: hypothetical protein OSB65_19910 [Roseibacillus sp.]|nr:hypothetical protein [Roseibacillus sp.]